MGFLNSLLGGGASKQKKIENAAEAPGKACEPRYCKGESRWIRPSITVTGPLEAAQDLKNAMGKPAKELGWAVSSGEELAEGGNKIAIISIAPAGRYIGIDEFIGKRQAMAGLSVTIMAGLYFHGDWERASKEFDNKKIIVDYADGRPGSPGKEDFIMRHRYGILSFEYNLADRLKFEGEDRKKAMVAFGSLTEGVVKALFSGKEKKLPGEERGGQKEARELYETLKRDVAQAYGYKFE